MPGRASSAKKRGKRTPRRPAPAREAAPARAADERRYWLLKSEPESFSFEDLLAAPGQTTFWDGVRNYQARNLLRDELRPGDGVLFYHSNVDPPAIVGTARVVRGGYPDHTQFDRRSEHFDPSAKPEAPTWFMVDIQAAAPLARPLSLEELRAIPALAGMELLRRGSRLSVQPVRETEWKAILALGSSPRS